MSLFILMNIFYSSNKILNALNGVNYQIKSPYSTDAIYDTAYENNIDMDDCIKIT